MEIKNAKYDTVDGNNVCVNATIDNIFISPKAHIITDRTKATYAEFVDMEELNAEDDTVAGQDIADEGIQKLSQINASKKVA